ncbi:MAG TPA: ester cyclase [Ktedonobacterales bacterium]|nr:ester cyclase [Ktedonobacterales bacterium]
MSGDQNKATQRTIIAEAINKGNVAVATELIAEDHVALEPSPPRGPGRAGLLASRDMFFAAFPDFEWTVEEQVAEGDTVATYLIGRGTHLGAFMGIPPTGKRVTVPSMGFDYFRDGQCAKTRLLLDIMSLMQQLGVIPAPGQAQ